MQIYHPALQQVDHLFLELSLSDALQSSTELIRGESCFQLYMTLLLSLRTTSVEAERRCLLLSVLTFKQLTGEADSMFVDCSVISQQLPSVRPSTVNQPLLSILTLQTKEQV